MKEYEVGIGDEVVVSGLFTRRTGRQKNIPIVRFGNIASMPSEPIHDSETGLDFSAYLVEFRSIGGLSGSPVFAYLGPGRISPRGKIVRPEHRAFVCLLGVVRGHWNHKEPIPFQTAHEDEIGNINWGVGVVTPISELEPILNSEEFVKERENLDQKFLERQSPVSDMAEDEKAKFTQKDFETALKKVSRKIEPEKSK
jgi:hypothetical protein